MDTVKSWVIKKMWKLIRYVLLLLKNSKIQGILLNKNKRIKRLSCVNWKFLS